MNNRIRSRKAEIHDLQIQIDELKVQNEEKDKRLQELKSSETNLRLDNLSLRNAVGHLIKDNNQLSATISEISQRAHQMVKADNEEDRKRQDEIIVQLCIDSGSITYSAEESLSNYEPGSKEVCSL